MAAGRLHYWTSGSRGPWMLLTHATALDHHSFDELTPLLVEAGWRTVAWDLPGHGQSPPANGRTTMATLVDDAVAVMDDAAGAEPVTLLGHSLGGYLSQHVAFRRPDRIAALIAIGCTSATLLPARYQLRALRASAALIAALPAWVRRRHTAVQASHHPEVRRYVRRTSARVGTRSVLSVWTALTHGFADEPERRLQAPLLIMHGTDDRTGIISSEAPRWARHHHGSKYVVVPCARHNAHQDNPTAVAAAVQAFTAQ
ncbi:alpha/beta fold hydrolase [Kribbella sp. CA-293567]|uniref:alpha/beta fold hydrolase n=1 Tax=Kribbella sp. CA-293567 TaxID=3002436 RepID=UPI0022DE55E4|nr:alpha/beta hydrolase [Kribbella sp. CA-293567]WBQ08331.1 alpha/beta hydrolase [Kribbella sp. CA-293567]